MPRLAEDAFEWEELNAFKVLAKIGILLSSIFLFCLAPFLLQSVRCTRCKRADAPWRSQLSHNAPARCFGSASVCVWAAVFGVFSHRLFSWVLPHWRCVVAHPAPQQLLQWAYWSPTPLLQPGETVVNKLKHTFIILAQRYNRTVMLYIYIFFLDNIQLLAYSPYFLVFLFFVYHIVMLIKNVSCEK